MWTDSRFFAIWTVPDIDISESRFEYLNSSWYCNFRVWIFELFAIWTISRFEYLNYSRYWRFRVFYCFNHWRCGYLHALTALTIRDVDFLRAAISSICIDHSTDMACIQYYRAKVVKFAKISTPWSTFNALCIWNMPSLDWYFY